MSKTILPGYVGRVGPDFGVKDYKASIDEILGTDFNQAAENAVTLAEQLLEFYPNNPDVYKHVIDGVIKLYQSGIGRAGKVAQDILDTVPVLVHNLADHGLEMK